MTCNKGGGVARQVQLVRARIQERQHPGAIAQFKTRGLVKGTSFNSLDQEKVAWILSNFNSYTRGMLDDATPYDEFVKAYGGGACLWRRRRNAPRNLAAEVKGLVGRCVRGAFLVYFQRMGRISGAALGI